MYVYPVVHKFTKSNQSFKPSTRTHRRAARSHHPPQSSCLCVEGGVSKAPGSGDVPVTYKAGYWIPLSTEAA